MNLDHLTSHLSARLFLLHFHYQKFFSRQLQKTSTMHLLLYHLCVMGALFSPAFAYMINWDGSQPRCKDYANKIQSIYNIVDLQMSETAVFSQGQTIACSELGSNGWKNHYWGYCAWVGNGGGNAFNRAKILTMLGYLLQAPHSASSCGSVPIDYPLLNNSYNALTVNYVYNIPTRSMGTQDQQGTLPNNDRGYAPGTCKVNFLQYQNFTGVGDPGDFIDASKAATTHMDVQILDANRFLIGETWYRESLPGQTWDLPSQLPAMLLVGVGTVQSAAIDFAYNGGEFNTSSSQCSFSGGFGNGVRQGSCNFPC